MNLVGFVFGWLLIFACMFSLSVHKTVQMRKTDLAETAYLRSERKILNSYESFCYKRLKKNAPRAPGKRPPSSKPSLAAPPYLNGSCAKLNLWPLVQEGRTCHPTLYRVCAELFRVLYEESLLKPAACSEFQILDAVLYAAKKMSLEQPGCRITLEQLSVSSPSNRSRTSLQQLYYQMLKGTKDSSKGYPTLLDYFSCESRQEKLCLRHSSLPMFFALFGREAGSSIFQAIREKKSPPSKEELLGLCSCHGAKYADEELIGWLRTKGSPHPRAQEKVFSGSEKTVCLKQRIRLPRP